jgi:hypothetical protein
MSTISLSLPESLHRTARDLAEKENVSLDQLITLALAEKIAALMTEEYLGERARRGDRDAFHKALSKVPDVEPEDRDRL